MYANKSLFYFILFYLFIFSFSDEVVPRNTYNYFRGSFTEKKFEKHYATPAHPVMHTYVHTYLFSSVRNHSKPMTAGRPCNIHITKIINRSTLTRLLTDCVCVCAYAFAVILTTRHKQSKGQHDSKYVRSFFQKVYPSHIRQIFSQDFKMRPEPKGNLPNNRLSPRFVTFSETD